MTRGYICNACERFYTGRAGADLKFALPNQHGEIVLSEAELCLVCARVTAQELSITEPEEGGNE
jgi:hypothetical protein